MVTVMVPLFIVKLVCGSGPGGSSMTRGWGIAVRHSGISGLSPFKDLVSMMGYEK